MTPARRNLIPYYYVVAGVLLQGLSPVLTKLLLEHLSAATVVGSRYALAVLTLAPFGVAGTRRAAVLVKPRPRDWAALFLIGALGSGLGALAFTSAIDLSSAGVANAISKTGPLFVSFFAFFTLRERITSMRLLLVLVMVAADLLIGVGELSAGGGAAAVHLRLWGDLLALAAGVLRALSEVMAKSALRNFSAAAVSLWRFGIGFVLTGAASFATSGYRGLLDLGWQDWALLGLLGIVATAVSMSLYYRGAARIPAHVAVTLKLLGTVVTAMLGWLVLGETLNLFHVAGIGLIVSGGYLLVVRTAKAPTAGVTWEPLASFRRARPSMPLRTRLIVFTSGVVLATVVALTALSISHTRQVITEQTQLTMSRVATMIVQMAGLPEPPPRESLQQYMDRVVGAQIEGDLYTIDIVYAALVNNRGNPLALSLNRRLALLNERGERVGVPSGDTARQFLDMVRTGKVSQGHGIVPVTAQIMRDGRPVLTVMMGCQRSIANRPIAEIAARMAALAFLVAGLGMAIAISVVGKLTRPLEIVARAMGRISSGERNVAVIAQGDQQSETISRALGSIVAELRSADSLQAELVRLVASEALRDRPDEAAGGNSEGEAVVLVTGLPPALRDELDAPSRVYEYIDAFASAVHGYEGALEGYHAGLLVALWGQGEEEADDPLRATLAGLEVAETLRDAGSVQPPVVTFVRTGGGHVVVTGDVTRAWELLGRAGTPGLSGVIVSREVAEAVQDFVVVTPLGDGETAFLVESTDGETGLEAAAQGVET